MAVIMGRLWLYGTGDPFDLEVWCHELEPVRASIRTNAEWAIEHFEGHTEDSLREMFGVPKDGAAYQVLFKGDIDGCMSDYEAFECVEWEEWFDVQESSFQPIPEDYLQYIFGGALKESSRGQLE